MKEAPLGSRAEIYMAKMEEPLPEDERAEETYCFISKIDGEINVEAEFGMKKLTEKQR